MSCMTMNCTARAMAKLGAFMANKGSLNGQTLMSEECWNEIHSDPSVKHLNTHLQITMTKGGLGVWGIEALKRNDQNYKPD